MAKQKDQVIASFVRFLAVDMRNSPERVQPLDSGLISRIEKLTRGMTDKSDESLGDEELL